MSEPTRPISLDAIRKGTFVDPEHQRRDIVRYVEAEINRGSAKEHKVTHLEKVKTEVVFGEKHVVWDVHTDEPGRWWVITGLTNLYSQEEFRSLDYTLSFHVGLAIRLAARSVKQAPDHSRNHLVSTWRRWESAAEALDNGEDPEDFQAVGMLCRETLVDLARSLKIAIEVDVKTESPKTADFVGWSDYAVDRLVAGRRNRRVRSYLRSNSAETWQLVNWLTHESKATAFEARLAVEAVATILNAMSSVLANDEAEGPDICPKCNSFRVVEVFEPDEEPPYFSVCEACGWSTRDVSGQL